MMNAYLIYPDSAWKSEGAYDDLKSIIQDLGLDTIFRIAAQDTEMENGEVKRVLEPDPFISETMRKVMMVPVPDKDVLYYRQAILKDGLADPRIFNELYAITSDILLQWDKLGRRINDKTTNRNRPAGVITQINLLRLFVEGLSRIKNATREWKDNVKSEGLKDFANRMEEHFTDEREEELMKLLQDISFFLDSKPMEGEKKTSRIPKITIECSIGNGLKLDDVDIMDVATDVKKYRDPNSALGKVQEYMNSRIPDSFPMNKSVGVTEQSQNIIFQIVQYLVGKCDPFMNEFSAFFDQLHMESGFYKGAVTLKGHFERFEIEYCFPTVSRQEDLRFKELKEAVMCIEQRIKAVGNTCDIRDKMLLIVTGANQGGKSTFLRSIGIAQVMMQSGLFVAALQYESGLFTSFFTHFTRREDSSMNSGRLDEELGRMSHIVDRLRPATMILLNESFATTTEKEGSVIAYDIIKALLEAGAKILTVTHLLSFAQKVYEESEVCKREGHEPQCTFLSAERKEDGKRTYRMIEHAPSLTSFGLDLYKEIVGEITGFG